MNCSYWINVIFLLASVVAAVAQNRTVEKWEKAFEALRRRNFQADRKPLEISPSLQKDKYNPFGSSYGYFESSRTSKNKDEESQESQSVEPHQAYHNPYHNKEVSQEDEDLENHVSQPHKEAYREPDYSIEDHPVYHEKGDYYHPHSSYSHSASEVDSKPRGETFRYRKTPRYRPPDLYSSAPLIPAVFRANSPYNHPPFPPRIYLPYRPSNRYKERITLPLPPQQKIYDHKAQDIEPKYHYDSELYESPIKAKYHQDGKESNHERSSSSYLAEGQHSGIPSYQPHYSYTDGNKNYGSPYGYSGSGSQPYPSEHHSTPEDIQRKPDPYYASDAYARDKTFGVDPLAKGFIIPSNESAQKFSNPIFPSYSSDKHFLPHSDARNPSSFAPSFGPSGYPKEKYSPRESYTNSFDDSDSRFKYPIRPFAASSKNERDPYLPSGSTFEGQRSFGLSDSGGKVFDNKGETVNAPSDLSENLYTYSHGSTLETNSPLAHSNHTSEFNASQTKADRKNVKISQPPEESTVLVFSPVLTETAPRCSLEENSTFCLHDTEYPYASVSDAISKDREKLETLLLDVPENETSNDSTSYYGSCQTRIQYGALMRAVNTEGKWKVIAKLPQNYDSHNYSQVLRLQECYSPGSPCSPSDPNSGRCLQKYAKRTLLSWSADKGLHTDVFNLPLACVCHQEGYRYPEVNQIHHQMQQEQRNHRTG